MTNIQPSRMDRNKLLKTSTNSGEMFPRLNAACPCYYMPPFKWNRILNTVKITIIMISNCRFVTFSTAHTITSYGSRDTERCGRKKQWSDYTIANPAQNSTDYDSRQTKHNYKNVSVRTSTHISHENSNTSPLSDIQTENEKYLLWGIITSVYELDKYIKNI